MVGDETAFCEVPFGVHERNGMAIAAITDLRVSPKPYGSRKPLGAWPIPPPWCGVHQLSLVAWLPGPAERRRRSLGVAADETQWEGKRSGPPIEAYAAPHLRRDGHCLVLAQDVCEAGEHFRCHRRRAPGRPAHVKRHELVGGS